MSTSNQINAVWVFSGNGGSFPAAVFSTKHLAEEWIRSTGVSGTLTEHPLNISAYEWSITNGSFTPRREDQKQPKFIQQFSSASQDHYHYESREEV